MSWLSTTVVKICVFLVGIVRVAVDQPGEQAAVGLDAERQRRDVEQHEVLDVAAQDAALDGGADRHHLVGVDLAVRLAAEDLLAPLRSTMRRAGLAADQQHLVDLVGAQAGLLQGVAARALGALDQVAHQVLELRRGRGCGRGGAGRCGRRR